MNAKGALKSTAPTTPATPGPTRRATRDANTAPTSPPTAPIPKASPICPGSSPRVRLAKRMTTADATNEKRFTTVEQPSVARR